MTPSFAGTPRFGRVVVLEADADLCRGLDEARRADARRRSAARVIHRLPGVWDAAQDAADGRDGLGLLVVSGILVRRVGMGGRYGAELLSAGDLLQPAHHDGETATVPFEATWRVLAPTRLAVLDLAWMRRLAPYPEVTAALAARIMQRSRRLASTLAIVQQPRLDDRLRLLFWELADRYGRVTPAGVRLELPLTHEMIGHLAGALRPSVSAALSRMERDGVLERAGDAWLVHGAPPAPIDTLTPSTGT